MSAKRARQPAPAAVIDVDALENVPSAGISTEHAVSMLHKLSAKQVKEVMAALVQQSDAARIAIKRKHDSIAAKPVNLQQVQQQITKAAQSARPKQGFLKVVANTEQMPAVPALQALGFMADALIHILNRRFLWDSDFPYEYGRSLAAAVQRMSPAELESVPNLAKLLDDVSVALCDSPKDALKTFNKEVGKRRAYS